MAGEKPLTTRALSESGPAKLCGLKANPSRSENPLEVAVVIASYDGGEKAIKCLESLERMTFKNYNVIVVDNASSDDSVEKMQSWLSESSLRAKTEILQMTENYGPSGAYGRGLKDGAERDFPWIWLLDQDSVVEPQALAELFEALKSLSQPDRVGILTSVPLNPRDGLPYGTSGYWIRGAWKRTPPELFSQQRPFPIDLAGYSGTLVRREVVETAGVPREDFFIGWCDIEFYLRVRRKGFLAFQVPKSRIFLPMGDPRMVDVFGFHRHWRSNYPPWWYYYVARNMTYTTVYRYPGIEGILRLPYVLGRWTLGFFVYSDDQKWQRVASAARGTLDGLFGRLGKRLKFSPDKALQGSARAAASGISR